jgi:yecA family protein
VFQSLQAADHGFDARADLFVAVDERGSFRGERFMPLSQGAILFLELIHAGGELFDTFFESLELEIELRSCCVAHAKKCRAGFFARSIAQWPSGIMFPMQHANYSDIQLVLSQAHSLTDAAEAHGTLVGCLCAAVGYRFEDWLQEILPEGRAAPDETEALRELFSSTAESLDTKESEFEPLLPEDEQSIDARTAALALWCQGFLYGLGASALNDATQLEGEVGEVVRDLTEITKVAVDAGDSAESNESAYSELVEFVRVGVQLLFEELEPLRDQPPPSTESLH